MQTPALQMLITLDIARAKQSAVESVRCIQGRERLEGIACNRRTKPRFPGRLT